MKFERLEYLWNLRGSALLTGIFQTDEKEREKSVAKPANLSDSLDLHELDFEKHRIVGVQLGHMFVTLKENKMLLALDAVPTSRQLTENQTHQLSSALSMGSSAPTTAISSASASSSSSASSSTSSSQSALPPLSNLLSKQGSTNRLGGGGGVGTSHPKDRGQQQGGIPRDSGGKSPAGGSGGMFPFVHRERERERDQRFVQQQSDSLEGLLFSVSVSSPIIGFQIFEKLTRGDGGTIQTFVLLRANSLIEIWQFNRVNYAWAKVSDVRLLHREVVLSEAAFTAPGDDTIVLAYSEGYHNKEGLSVCDCYTQVVEVRDNPHVTEVVVSEPEKVLSEVPLMSLTSMRGGFAFFPKARSGFSLGSSPPSTTAPAAAPTTSSSSASSSTAPSPSTPTSSSSAASAEERIKLSNLCYFWSPKTRILFSLVWGAAPRERSAASEMITVSTATTGGSPLSAVAPSGTGGSVTLRRHDLSPDLWRPPLEDEDHGNDDKEGATGGGSAGVRPRGAATKSHAPPRIVSVTVHSVTKELLVLEDSGDVVVCSLEGGTFAAKKFTHIELKEEIGQGKIFGFGMQKAHINMFGLSQCWTFNIRSGKMIQKTGYPFTGDKTVHVWHNQSAGGNHGIWGTEGIWQLQSQRVTDFFSDSTPSLKGTTEGRLDDIFLAKLWGLKRHQVKYSLDLSMKILSKSQHSMAGDSNGKIDGHDDDDETAFDSDVLENMYGGGAAKSNGKAKVRESPDGMTGKLSFDLKSEEDAVSVAAARYLLNSSLLESPVLPVAILSGFEDQRLVTFEALQKFLKIYHGDKQPEKDPSKALKTFQLRTPLNDQLEPLMEKYVNAASKRGTEESGIEQFSQDAEYLVMVHNQAEEVVSLLKRASVTLKTGKGKLLDGDRARMETLSRKSPGLVLSACEEFLKLPRFDEYSEEDELSSLYFQFAEEVAQDVSVEGVYTRIQRHPMFELLCDMYSKEQPQHISKFIAFVHYCQVKFHNSQSRSGYSGLKPISRKDKARTLEILRRRALQAINTSNLEDIHNSKNPEVLVNVIVSLMFGVNEKSRALKFLLAIGRWETGIELVGTHMDKEVQDHFELFNTLLLSYLEFVNNGAAPLDAPRSTLSSSFIPEEATAELGPNELLAKIWGVMPRNYSIYELLTLLQSFDTPQEGGGGAGSGGDILCHDGRLTVGDIRGQLLAMFARETRPRTFQ